ncbi:MAG TPA: helix-hairpin-helix domain-containing protein [Candidatus Gallacutalibacter stercoravium]|nr:helix-hairpin-helix domain-containing protein [Candidatus Gallacutalibacter stercoravium]
MEQKVTTERVLIAVALLLCALLIGYNAFYIPSAQTPQVILVEGDLSAIEEQAVQGSEAYDPRPASSQPGKLNVNTASVEELMELPGIGEVLAGRIVAYRQQQGNFSDLQQLLQVDGIGDALYEKMAPYLTV